MKIAALTRDNSLLALVQDIQLAEQSIHHIEETDPVEVLSAVCDLHPQVLLCDDDLLRPNSAQVLRNIRKLHRDVMLIFLTSDSGLEVGRSVSQIGVQYYAIKPLSAEEFEASLAAVVELAKKNQSQKQYH
jgi:DNA-binding response OmpR family regulator